MSENPSEIINESLKLIKQLEEIEPLEPAFLEKVFAPRLIERIDLLTVYASKTHNTMRKLNTIIEDKDKVIEGKDEIINVYLHVDLPKLQEEIKTYKELWRNKITIPDIKPHVTNHTVYDPWTDGTGYEDYRYEKLADNEYYSYSQGKWSDILESVHEYVKDQLPVYIAEISDCDEYSDAMNLAVKLAFIEAGKQRPPAFGRAVGRNSEGGTHAYNYYVLSNKKIMIYDPQSGETIGELGTLDKPYDPHYMQI